MKLFPMAIFLFTALFVTTSHALASRWRTDDEVQAMYESWLVKHGKLYYNTLGEKEKRFQIFKHNLRYIGDHNSGDHSYKLALNKFSDLTNDEYRLRYTRAIPKRKSNKVTTNRYSPLSDDDDILPDSVDWRSKGAVADIKNQQQCGSDYAFSAIGAVEGINQIVTGDLITLSEQQIIDCDKSNNHGCDGGSMTDVFKFIIENGGIDTDKDYPYTAERGECKKHKNVVSIDSFEDVPEGNESELQKAVANQPIAAAMEMDDMDLQFYDRGIYDGLCGSSANAGLVVVGYGTEDGNDYWLVRNSWGSGWGEEGYIRLKRNVEETTGKCGIATLASYPVKTNPTNPNRGREKRTRPLI
ncbi:unnamed protein product [Lactuca virosa]|uniref:Actinidain n=1 Tax=Lactuca virosa TaxID=75947 RepID=A0AAU9LY67_9ASTR|nr:unnamed protein product [Lactuca virosa]